MAVSDKINSVARRIPAWPIYALGLSYACWLFWLGVSDRLGAEPVKTLEHELGEMALYLLILGLMITPLRSHAKVNLIKFRRAIGVTCFFLVVLHLLTWAVLDVQQLDRVWADIVKRPYVTVGMAAFALLLPLAVTSNNLSVRRLGPAWRKLHVLVYPAVLLAGVHYLMLVKGFQIRPIVFLLIIAGLLALRARRIRGLLGF
ncbi:MAG: protein-methionine-sulfoxide reductase heme-binding subunit MsrQ [Roseovarius sp.]|nr:protein-methionine-sulfoxide reductase heme-binding subunit MsrQ [Roseovarius sp.]MCY4207853.1 protein-methionine-sulfoxide reductase heme-binding subunit MsrQ [Roseovarius sp.]MCY4291883.1 protein-methionine-sulfoxide reductase heme-binding subunit MsrQ [Roseovarius sp.]MCY4316688.1 protein-methionine-sulfoxide reductase heme-binding subunit MsrQ [Roseovarius sp.]